MGLVRITPDNAVDTVRQQLDAFVEAVAGAGHAPAMLKLAEAAEGLGQIARSGCLEVELLTLGGLHPAWTGTIAQWLGVDPERMAGLAEKEGVIELPPDLSRPASVVRMRSSLEASPLRAGARVPPILVVARGGKEPPDKDVLDRILEQIRGRPLTLLLAPKSADWAKALSGLGSRDSWVCKARELEEIAASGMTLGESLEHPPWKQAGRLAESWSLAGALASLYEAFAVALEREDRAARAKKAGVEQQAQRLQGTPMPTEILGEVRGQLQKQFDRFQKILSRQLKDLVAPQEGSLWLEINAAVETLDRFDKVKKPKADAVSIPEEFQRPLLERIREALGDVCHASLVELRDFLRDIKESIERSLEERGGPPVVLQFQHIPAERVDTVLQRSVAIQRPYKGEITRKGLMDFFMAARRYQMLFFMVFSAFGLSFIRSFTAFTIPAGIMLMSYGMLNVVNGARKQRAEAEQKELEKARDMLRGELSRAMTDVQKNWDQAVSTFLGDQQAAALELIEGAVRSSSALDSRQAAGDKELVQQQIKSLDASQRKLAEGMKKAEAASQELEQIRGSLIEFYAAATKPPEAGAGATPASAPPAAGAGAGAPPSSRAAVASAADKAAAPGAGDAAQRAAELKAQAEQKLAALRAGGGASAGKPKPWPTKPGAAPAGASPAAGSAGGAAGARSTADPEALKRQARERLEALKAKARASMPAPPKKKDGA